MSLPKVISIYSRTSSCGKKTIALNVFLSYVKINPGMRVLIVDFLDPETLRYSLNKYGKSSFTSTDFLSEISDDILVNEALSIFEDQDQGSFLRILPSSGCLITLPDQKKRLEYRKNALFFRNTIDLLIFLLPVSIEENSISMNAILESDMIWIMTTEKYPEVSLTRSAIQNFFNFLTKPTLLLFNKIKPPLLLTKLDRFREDLEKKIRQPIWYLIPWLEELNNFSNEGIFQIENPDSTVNEIFKEINDLFQEFTASSRVQPDIKRDGEESPIALFFTDTVSGATMYYYFFGKAEDEMKNPALITAAMMSIAQMVSETAGRRGDLHFIDNGNVKIYLRKGKMVLGILYTPIENDQLVTLLSDCIQKFEKEFKDSIIDFSKTGRIGGFSKARELVEQIFEFYIFDIHTVSENLRTKILSYGTQKDLLHGDPEELFKEFAKNSLENEDIRFLLMLEFTSTHNARHNFLLELGLNPHKFKNQIEAKTGNLLCSCTRPPEYVQIQAYDALAILSLPEKLKPTARALFTSNVLSPETAAKITKRDEIIELQCLEELRKLGYVRLISPE
ncbi:hypothetical protein [Candidatus Hodarchaeum mangrovi]